MRILILLAIFAVVSICNAQRSTISHASCGLGTTGKIVGGTYATRGDWGWQIVLNYNSRLICGGSILNENWIITAGHCVYGALSPYYYTVDVGVYDRSIFDTWSVRKSVSKVIIHESYSNTYLNNDIALIKLSTPITFDLTTYKIVPVCIPDGTVDFQGKNAWVTGFGSTYSGGSAVRYLTQVQLPILTNTLCVSRFNSIAPVSSTQQVCAGASGQGKDTCQGDSGGPLVVYGTDSRWYLVGLTSWGPNPCGNGGVYSRLSYFATWIRTKLAAN